MRDGYDGLTASIIGQMLWLMGMGIGIGDERVIERESKKRTRLKLGGTPAEAMGSAQNWTGISITDDFPNGKSTVAD
jgi:hypothetical protein